MRAASLLLSVLIALHASAQSTLSRPVLNTISPCVAQVGTTIDVTITGTDLDEASALHFSSPGITSKPGKKANTFTLTIAADAACGFADARVIAKYGISNPRGFAITKLPIISMKGSATSTLGHVFTGHVAKEAQSIITFPAKKGETFSVHCQPEAIDSRLDPIITLHDAKHAVLARMKGSTLTFTPKADGPITLDLRDMMYRGDAEFPFVIAIAKPGTSGLDTAPPLVPIEPMPTDLTKPIVGTFLPRGKPHSFTFTAKKGDVRVIEVRCARLGIDADPTFIVEKLDGEKATFIAEANDRAALAGKDEFDAGWADPSYRFEAKEDGTYRIKLRNLYPNTAPFELSVQPPGVAFELVAIPSEPLPAKKTTTSVLSAPLWQGGVSTLKVTAMRERGSTGPITLSAEALPAGVRSLGGIIAEGHNVGYLCIAADDKAAAWGGSIRVIGKSGDVQREARGAIIVRPSANTAKDPIYTRFTKDIALGVVASPVPLSIEPAAALYEVTANGKIDIPLKITRAAGVVEALKLTALGLVTEGPPTVDIPAKGVTASLVRDVAKLKLTPGDHSVVLQTAVKFKPKGKEVTTTIHSKPFIIRVQPEVKR